MKYIDGFREKDAALWLNRQIAQAGDQLAARGRTVHLMEVCGSHTMAVSRSGIREMLPSSIRLLSGPGCPVCVTDAGYVDAAIRMAEQGAIIVTFGDMVRVPGSHQSLADVRAQGGDVRICYSPADALRVAAENPGREVVFLAIGFETTAAPVTTLIPSARQADIRNLSLLTAFKRVPPALEALVADEEVQVDGFICPAHVSAIIGAEAYRPCVEGHHLPCTICGFEPLDILYGIVDLAEQLVSGRAELVNQYSRVVRPGGNPAALQLFEKYLTVCDASWRGIGTIPDSGMAIRGGFVDMDAARRFGVSTEGGRPDPGCRCGDVLKGKIIPPDCPHFGHACTPPHPVGPCMVSSEGSCAAFYRYGGGR